MKKSLALIGVLLFALTSAHAQTSQGATQQPPLNRTPGASAPQSATPSQASTAAPKPAANAPAAVSPEEDKSIRRLMQLLGTDTIAQNLNQQLSYQLRDAMKQRGMSDDQLKQLLEDFGQKFSAQSVNAQVNTAIMQVFAANLSAEDITGLVQFYESPLGNRFMNALPNISRNSQEQGVKIVQQQAIAALRQMTDQYPQLKTMLPQDSSAPAGAQPPVRSIPDDTPHLQQEPSSSPSSSPAPQNH